MNTARPNLFTRDDTFFGICQALGEDLGFPPNILRIALPVLLFVSPVAAIGGYAAAGVIVAASRYLFPAPHPAARPQAETELRASAEEQMELLPRAA